MTMKNWELENWIDLDKQSWTFHMKSLRKKLSPFCKVIMTSLDFVEGQRQMAIYDLYFRMVLSLVDIYYLVVNYLVNIARIEFVICNFVICNFQKRNNKVMSRVSHQEPSGDYLKPFNKPRGNNFSSLWISSRVYYVQPCNYIPYTRNT